MPEPGRPLLLSGLAGQNPLAFLASLGTLRLLTRTWPEREVRMSWTVHAGAYRPVLFVNPPCEGAEVIGTLDRVAGDVDRLFPPGLRDTAERRGPNTKRGEPAWRGRLRFPPDVLTEWFHRSRDTGDALTLEYLAAWASDGVSQPAGDESAAARTALDFTAGQQAFVGMVGEVRAQCNLESLREALFGPWRYVPGTSMRWDPRDEKRQYAIQAVDPTNAAGNPVLAVPGANLLAIEALPLFPLMPVGGRVAQAGVRPGRPPELVWPVWDGALDLDTVRAVLGHDASDTREARARGIVAVYRSLITMPSGRYRCFTPASVR